ncbi:MAG: hypothetical protein HYX96_01555 [Chloroflexi bacterium]|nr:hypothetical protein [Chloroflexota bacterium]
MIGWILERMEENPNAVFYGKELQERFPESFNQAIADRLLRRLPTDFGSYGYGHGSYLVIETESSFEALDEDDPEAEPIPLLAEDFAQYKLDLPVLAGLIQRANQLSGKPTPISERLFFLGDIDRDGVPIGYVLALVNASPITQAILLSLPALLSKSYRSMFAVCPSYVPAPPEVRKLEELGIGIVPLTKGFVLPSWEIAIVSYSSDFLLSENSVRWRGQAYPLKPEQAAVLRMLYGTYKMGTPDVSWTIIQQRLITLQMIPSRMRDIFRDSPLWKTLVIQSGKGIYRLNL